MPPATCASFRIVEFAELENLDLEFVHGLDRRAGRRISGARSARGRSPGQERFIFEFADVFFDVREFFAAHGLIDRVPVMSNLLHRAVRPQIWGCVVRKGRQNVYCSGYMNDVIAESIAFRPNRCDVRVNMHLGERARPWAVLTLRHIFC